MVAVIQLGDFCGPDQGWWLLSQVHDNVGAFSQVVPWIAYICIGSDRFQSTFTNIFLGHTSLVRQAQYYETQVSNGTDSGVRWPGFVSPHCTSNS